MAKDNPTSDCEGVAKNIQTQMAAKGTPAQPSWIKYCAKSCTKFRGTSAATATAETAEVDEQMKGALDAACHKVAQDNASMGCDGVAKAVDAELAKKSVTAKPEWLVYCGKSCKKLRGK